MPQTKPFLSVRSLSHTYHTNSGETPALRDIHFDLFPGEFAAIVGPSGCGKSTLLNAMAGFLKPTSGEIKIENQIVQKPSMKYVTIFQNYGLLPWRTVQKNVELGLETQKYSKEKKANIASHYLKMVGLEHAAKKRPAQLSGGEQQRVALARALVNRPDILLADEPTGNLDPKTSEEIMKLLEQINDRGTTVVVVTHNKDIVNSMRKRVVTMHEGSIISDEKEGEYHEA